MNKSNVVVLTETLITTMPSNLTALFYCISLFIILFFCNSQICISPFFQIQNLAENIGLSSTDASRVLQTTVKDELKHYRQNHQFQFFHDAFDTFYRVKSAPVDWFGIILVFAEAALLFAGYHLGDENTYACQFICTHIWSIIIQFFAYICKKNVELNFQIL